MERDKELGHVVDEQLSLTPDWIRFKDGDNKKNLLRGENLMCCTFDSSTMKTIYFLTV